MKTVRLLSVIGLALAWLAACSSPVQPAARVVAPPPEGAVPSDAATAADSPLLLEALNADRTVQPGAEEVFDLKMVNATGQPMAVVVVLEHAAGQRWRTSLCVDKQCLLGDGDEPSVTDPVTLPPYLEQAFNAHVFVDAAARQGQQTALSVRVEPLTGTAKPQSVLLTAQVASP